MQVVKRKDVELIYPLKIKVYSCKEINQRLCFLQLVDSVLALQTF